MFAGGGVAEGRHGESPVGIVDLDARRRGRHGSVPNERDRAGVAVERRREDPRGRCADRRKRERPGPAERERLDRGVAVVDRPRERAGEDVLVSKLVGERGASNGVSDDLAGHRAGVGLAVGRAGQDGARGVEQFEHRVEGGGGLVDVEPHLRPGVGAEAEDVDVGRIVGGDRATNDKAVAPIVVAGLALDRFRRRRAGRERRREDAEHLGCIGDLIDVDQVRVRLLRLADDGDVGVVREGEELQAPPTAGHGGRRRGVDPRPAIVVGVEDSPPKGIKARTDGVVVEAREHDRVARSTNDLNRAADPIVDLTMRSRGGKAGIGAVELDHEARSGLALQPQACGGVEIVDRDLAAEDVDDVGVVPDAVDGDLTATNDHAADRRCIAGGASLRQIVVGCGIVDRVAHILERPHRQPGEGVDARIQIAGEQFGAEGRFRPMGAGGP